jgi:hypothetical protein
MIKSTRKKNEKKKSRLEKLVKKEKKDDDFKFVINKFDNENDFMFFKDKNKKKMRHK